MHNEKILPVILSGGTGSRLWPSSRASFPKQYLSISDEKSLTFFQQTVKRVSDHKNFDPPIVICNEEDRFIVAEQLRDLNINSSTILLEPIGRNTAPAITLSAIKALEKGYDPLLLILPADHLIGNLPKFQDVLKSALKYCMDYKLVTFGIKPDKAETGYGYIEADNMLDFNKTKGEKIVNFLEKPNREIANKLFNDKKYSWNSGIFFFKASVFIAEIKKNKPDIYKFCKDSLSSRLLDLDFQRVDAKLFKLCESISIDNAIMEKTNKGIVLPLDAGWCDIGSWESMWDSSEKDKNGNVFSGNILAKNVKNSLFRSEERLVVGIGLEDMIVVETLDAILVSDKNKTQDVKEIVKNLEVQGKSEARIHKTIYRPWGNYTSIAEGSNWQVKRIIVNSGGSLSLQKHLYRSENWVVVDGTALVEIEGQELIINKNQSAYIPPGAKHRLSNPSKENLILIEVQSGNYLGEDDIIRFEDKYGRVK